MSNFMYGDNLITIKMGDKTPNGHFSLFGIVCPV